jgi:ketose-bisphosphate aldolase
MPMVPMRQILDEAAKGGYGVGAFNVNNMEQIQAIMAACEECQSPVIIQASRGALKYSQMEYLRHLMQAAVELHPDIPVALHLDHGNSPATCKKAIELGFTSVMMDGSLTEDGKSVASYEYNVGVTKEVVAMAHAAGVTVEGELGALGGIEDGHGAGLDVDDTEHLTDPKQAEEFVAETGIDALAVAIGTSHGAYKSLRKDPKTGEMLPPALAMERIHEIHALLPHCHMVMHGSSSVPPELDRRHQRIRRQDAGFLRHSGAADPGRHQARRPQDQRRHRQPPRDDRRGAQAALHRPLQVRSARLARPRARCDEGSRQGAHARLRQRGPREGLRADHPRRHEEALRGGQA